MLEKDREAVFLEKKHGEAVSRYECWVYIEKSKPTEKPFFKKNRKDRPTQAKRSHRNTDLFFDMNTGFIS